MVFLFLASLPAILAETLTLHPGRSSPYDLAITGRLAGVPSGEIRYARWADLRALPTTVLTLNGEFTAGEQKVTALFLSDLWAALPSAADADVVLATCTDGYAAVFPRDFLASHRPFVVLEIDGRGPDAWPPAGLSFNPGPYVITVSPAVAPEVAGLLDASHKRPWGVATLEIANYAEKFAALLEGSRATATGDLATGREIWVHSCLSCHAGPGKTFGGTKSDRPFEVLAAHATHNAEYFKRYVRDPKAVMPAAQMEAHPHYTDAQLDALIAFLRAGRK